MDKDEQIKLLTKALEAYANLDNWEERRVNNCTGCVRWLWKGNMAPGLAQATLRRIEKS